MIPKISIIIELKGDISAIIRLDNTSLKRLRLSKLCRYVMISEKSMSQCRSEMCSMWSVFAHVDCEEECSCLIKITNLNIYDVSKFRVE